MKNSVNYLSLIGRSDVLFSQDISLNEENLRRIIGRSRFLIIGGSGSIGQAVAREVFRRDPQVLHVVDISENNMVELVREIRSTIGYGSGDFRTFAFVDHDTRGRERGQLSMALLKRRTHGPREAYRNVPCRQELFFALLCSCRCGHFGFCS